MLAAEGGQALLVSVYALDTLPYHNQNQPVTWEWAAMRTWLNGAFLQQIFDGTEAAFVLTRELYNPANYVTGIYSGAATQDRVFLLSVEEVERYFMGAADRRAVNTPYANSKGAKTKNGYGTWWTRTAGSYEKNAAVVTADGNLGYKGYYMRDKVYTARPAIWVDLSGYMNSQLPPSG